MDKKPSQLISGLRLCFLALTLVSSVPAFALERKEIFCLLNDQGTRLQHCFLIIVEESTNNLHEEQDDEPAKHPDVPLRDDFSREQNPGGMCLSPIICNMSSCFTEVDSLGFIMGTNTRIDHFVRSNSDCGSKGNRSPQVTINEVALKEKAEFGIKTVNFLSKVCRIVLRSLGHYKIAATCSLVKLAGDVIEDHEEYWDTKRKPVFVILSAGHEYLTLSENDFLGFDPTTYTKLASKVLMDLDKNLDKQDRIISEADEKYLAKFGFNLAILFTVGKTVAIALGKYQVAGIMAGGALLEDILAIGYEGVWSGKTNSKQCRDKANLNLWYFVNHALQASLTYRSGYKSPWLTTAFIVELMGEFSFRELYCRQWVWNMLAGLMPSFETNEG